MSFEGGTAQLRLILESAECAECVLPKPMLEDVATKLLGVPVLHVYAGSSFLG